MRSLARQVSSYISKQNISHITGTGLREKKAVLLLLRTKDLDFAGVFSKGQNSEPMAALEPPLSSLYSLSAESFSPASRIPAVSLLAKVHGMIVKKKTKNNFTERGTLAKPEQYRLEKGGMIAKITFGVLSAMSMQSQNVHPSYFLSPSPPRSDC